MDAFAAVPWELTGRILTASLLGALLGLERGLHGRAAGLRTHFLVSAGSAVFMILSIYVARFGMQGATEMARISDPGRIAAQVVAGIGFLGAGAIIKEGFTVRGLTTAASLWITAAIGMAAGAGFFFIAVSTTFIALFSLVSLHSIEKLYPKDVYRQFTVVIPNDADVSGIVDLIKSRKIKIIYFDIQRDYDSQHTTVEMFLRLLRKEQADKAAHGLIEALEQSGIPLRSIKWSHD